jgi:hypothetical protein
MSKNLYLLKLKIPPHGFAFNAGTGINKSLKNLHDWIFANITLGYCDVYVKL